MPLDALTLRALTGELSSVLPGAKIDKIQQPERDLLLLSLRTPAGNRRLLISAGTGKARVHFTEEHMENPAEPPMFCMLLRKHLRGGRILSVAQPEGERLLILTVDTRDEMGDASGRELIVELIGRSSNVILTGADGRIVDCLRRVEYAGDELRRLLPGMIYRLPPKQNKPFFLDTDSDMRRELIARADRSVPPEEWLLRQFSGLSPLICRELAFRSGQRYENLPAQLDALQGLLLTGDVTPTMLIEDGQPRDFSFLPLLQYGETAANRTYGSFSELLDAFYAQRERLEIRRRHSHDLLRSVRGARDRLQRKIAAQRQEFRRTESREEIRKQAELITANLYRLKRGERELVCEDYYAEGCPEIRIPLDALKTPQQNAAAMYREYNRLKSAEQHLTRLLAQEEKELEYLNSVLDEIERAESDRDLLDLRRELAETGYFKKQTKGKGEKSKPQSPLRYMTDDGLEVLVGRSNLQNDELTTKIARRTDWWFHTQKIHGSHVILRCEDAEPPEKSIEQAAGLAVWHSQGRGGGKTAVDYTMVRFVRKPSGALPGKVIYTDYQTILAEADAELAARLKK